MYKILVFTHSYSTKEIEAARKWLTILEADYELFNIPNHRAEDHVASDSIIFGFGQVARIAIERAVEDKKLENTKVIELPLVKYLVKEQRNRITRKDAYDKLIEVKEIIKEDVFRPVGLVVREEDLPDLDNKHLLLLEKVTEEAGKDTCIQVSKNGKIIEIGKERMKDSKADIHLTFYEVYTIRQIMDVLKVKEVQLVNSNKTDPI